MDHQNNTLIRKRGHFRYRGDDPDAEELYYVGTENTEGKWSRSKPHTRSASTPCELAEGLAALEPRIPASRRG